MHATLEISRLEAMTVSDSFFNLKKTKKKKKGKSLRKENYKNTKTTYYGSAVQAAQIWFLVL